MHIIACNVAHEQSSLGGNDWRKKIGTIPDILKAARGGGIVNKVDSDLELGKNSILRLHDDGQLDLHYEIGNGDKDLSLGKINGYSTTTEMRDNGLLAALAKTKFGDQKILITSSMILTETTGETHWYLLDPIINGYSNWFYDIYFTVLSNDADGNISQSRFGAWRYPEREGQTTSGYIKDIKTGIFVDGFDGELVVAATMEATNDNMFIPVSYGKKLVDVRLDFWALFDNDSGDIRYKKLDELNVSWDIRELENDIYYHLNGIKNVGETEWSRIINNDTTSSPYILLKAATGDFNHDGYENEIAVLTSNSRAISMYLYQITYDTDARKFSIKAMPNSFRNVYRFNAPDFFIGLGYNGTSRTLGGDILAGDFDGDGKTEIAVVCYGDATLSEHDTEQGQMYHRATTEHLYTNLYKWNNTTGTLDAVENKTSNYGMSYSRENYTWHKARVGSGEDGFSRLLYMLWGGLKAVTLDINGDGTDEIAIAGARSRLYEYARAHKGSSSKHAKHYATYKVTPFITLVGMDKSDRKLKPTKNFTYEGDAFINRRFDEYYGKYNNHEENPFHIQPYHLTAVGYNKECYPFIDREFSLVAGPFYGTQGVAKACDDLALRIYGDKMIIFKSNGSTLSSDKTIDAVGTSAIVAADFAGEGVELGKPTHVISDADRSYMVVLQAPPYHVDNITDDGTTLTQIPTNFSYVKGATTSYEKSSVSEDKANTKFDIHSTVETVFAIDSDTTRNVVQGYQNVKSAYDLVKTIAGFIPGVSNYAKAADGVVNKATGFLDSLMDKIEYIQEGFNDSINTSKALSNVMTERLDMIHYVTSNQNIWRYPILMKPAPEWGIDYTSVDKYVTKQDFITFTLYDEVRDVIVQNDNQYQPTHENGNLFSYPSSVENIEGYAENQKVLSRLKSLQIGTTTNTDTLRFEEANVSSDTRSTKVTQGYISQGLSLIDSLFGTNLAKLPAPEIQRLLGRRRRARRFNLTCQMLTVRY